ncbi:hypothetical protein [Haloarcula salinisoli]|uniref:Uncharacterized protein n=1 Tax=Haloarcula salinisoli TaxID=2487746 RepID=A0A8J7YJZ4_9EURY|nr:hypothetical protein [Halomicroarcula salinisoli]MBX0285903.1 hypothetical protein [Halomicroarcula salinisoli]MBX0302603.1 hypothetical protein [Halomicroarcula salinisoli]
MEEIELGQATIVYEGTDGETVEETLDNEEIVYARDHWHVHTGTDEDGNDLMTQIPKERVHRVDRNVEKFEDQAGTVRRRVESLASDLRERIPVDVGNGGRRETMQPETGQQEEARTIPVDDGGAHEQGAAEAQSDAGPDVGADDDSEEK